jgi:hypothetical protein
VGYVEEVSSCTGAGDIGKYCNAEAVCPEGKVPVGVTCYIRGTPAGNIGPVETTFRTPATGDNGGACYVRGLAKQFSVELVVILACI